MTIPRAEYEELRFQSQWLWEQRGLTKTAVLIFFCKSPGRGHGANDHDLLTYLETYAFGTRSAASEHIVRLPFAFVCLHSDRSFFFGIHTEEISLRLVHGNDMRLFLLAGSGFRVFCFEFRLASPTVRGFSLR